MILVCYPNTTSLEKKEFEGNITKPTRKDTLSRFTRMMVQSKHSTILSRMERMVMLEPDVREFFSTSDDVNKVLGSLLP